MQLAELLRWHKQAADYFDSSLVLPTMHSWLLTTSQWMLHACSVPLCNIRAWCRTCMHIAPEPEAFVLFVLSHCVVAAMAAYEQRSADMAYPY